MNRYESDHPNQVHQLVVSVSRHFYVRKKGVLKWQKKPFEISLPKLYASDRNHIVHYIVRDHFSGTFYGEIGCAQDMVDAMEFLHRAWSQKEHHPFCGIPYAITLPKTVMDTFPNVEKLVDGLGVEKIKATSGFQSGIRDIRTWEEYFRSHPRLDKYEKSYENLKTIAPWISREICTSYDEKRDKLKKWRKGIETLKIPPPLERCKEALGLIE